MASDVRRRVQDIADIAIPVVVALFLASLVESTVDLAPALKIVGALVGLVLGASLWWRRSHPELVMVVTLAGSAFIQLVAPGAVFPYASLIALGSLAAHRSPRRSLPALVGVLGVTALDYLDYLSVTDEDATFAMVVAVVPWALGEAARSRRTAIVEESRRAVSEEQARIARELHDVLAHSVSVIVVQAAAADDVFDEHPDQARGALRSIETVGRDALGELRRVLTAVQPPTEPRSAIMPILDRLTELAGPLRAAGLAVVVRHEGPPAGPLPSEVDRSAYRIVQEALTNALRHSGAGRVDVTLRSTAAGMLELEVIDDGGGSVSQETQPAGRGIRGMRERATMLGGTLEAGARTDRTGYRVLARLPLERST